jgi:hypothetical protein
MKLVIICCFLSLLSFSSIAQVEREEFTYLSSEVSALNLFTINQLNDSFHSNQPRRTCHLWGQVENSILRLEVVGTRLNDSYPDELELKRLINSLQTETTMSLKGRLDSYCYRNQALDVRFLSGSISRVKSKLDQISAVLLRLSQK